MLHLYTKHLKKIILIALLSTSCGSYAQDTLVFALDLIRHGDRTPLLTIPKAPYSWQQGYGQLTPTGMRQEWQLGISFHKKYIDQYHLLPAHFQNDTVYVFSTNVDRTLMSAQSVLLGLYPPGTGPSLPHSNKPALANGYQPIPIHPELVAGTDRYQFSHDENKRSQKEAFKQYVESRADWIQKTAQLKSKFPQWSNATGLPLTRVHQLGELADTLYIGQLYHLPPPAGLSSTDVQDIITEGKWAFLTTYQTKKVAVIAGSPILAAIRHYIKNASKQKTPLKYVLLSAHDATIMSVMTTLQTPLTTLPPYASDLNFALFKSDQGMYTVKVSYNDKPVTIPGCQITGCTLKQFLKLTKEDQDIS